MKHFFDARCYCLFSFALVALALIATASPAAFADEATDGGAILDWAEVPYTDSMSLSSLEAELDSTEATEEVDLTEATSIPEPAAIALLAGGLASMGLMRWRLG